MSGKYVFINGNADAATVSYTAPISGAVATTVEDKLAEVLSVKDFGAVGDGFTDDTAAIERAGQALTGNQTLYFPDGTYLVSYIWTPLTDSDPTNLPGRGRGIMYFNGVPNIRLYGPRATIKCVNHNIATNGGLLFALFEQSPGWTIDGFYFDMSFTGHNTSASYYPMCGGVWTNDKYAGAGTQSTLCSNGTAQNLTFKLYHPEGAFAITSAPYGGTDSNNGFKIISVFASGDSAATAYDEQSRDLLMQNIKFLNGHNGYGCWGVAFNNATFRDIKADAWVLASYTIATATYTGVNSIGPVRFYQYYCDGFTVDDVQMISIPWASRTGAFQGRACAVAAESGLTDRTTGGGSITNVNAILDDDNAALGGSFDVGIYCSLSGSVRMSCNNVRAWGDAGAVAMNLVGADGTGRTVYEIDSHTTHKTICGPTVFIINGNNTGDSTRTIKSVRFQGTVDGWGSDGAIVTYRTGTTYYGVANLVIDGASFTGVGSGCSSGSAIDARGRTSADFLTVTDSPISGAASAIQSGSSTLVSRDNITSGNAGNSSSLIYLTNNQVQSSSWTAGQNATITVSGGDYYEYTYTEYTGAGAWVKTLSGIYNSGSGTIATVGAGGAGRLVYKKIGTIT